MAVLLHYGRWETTMEIRCIMLVTAGGALTLSLTGSSQREAEIDGKFQEGNDMIFKSQ